MSRNTIANMRKAEDGAAAVEFAIVSPVFLLIVVGILAYGLYFGAANSVQQLAADAARAAMRFHSSPRRSMRRSTA